MEAWIRADVASIEKASRASGISADKDELRARFAGTLAVVAVVDPRDKSAKVRVMVGGRSTATHAGAEPFPKVERTRADAQSWR